MSMYRRIFNEVVERIENDGAFYCIDFFSYEDEFPVVKCSRYALNEIHLHGASIHGLDVLSIQKSTLGICKNSNIDMESHFRFATDEEISAFKAHVIMLELS